jgi:hypothetical protein
MEINPPVNDLNPMGRPDSFTKTADVLYQRELHLDGVPSNTPTEEAVEESLVVDTRSEVSPAQLVEHKLTRMLRDASIPVSHMQVRSLLRAR